MRAARSASSADGSARAGSQHTQPTSVATTSSVKRMGASVARPVAGRSAARHNPRRCSALIDIGANLTHDSFDADRAAVLERAAAAGVHRLIVTGTSVTSSVQAAALRPRTPARCSRRPAFIRTTRRSSTRTAARRCAHLLANPTVVAVGECGLDYFRDFSPRAEQRHAFAAQLELAARHGQARVPAPARRACGLPRDSRAAARAASSGGVAHCFTGGPRELAAYLDLDLHIGVTGWVCDERRGAALRERAALHPARAAADRDRRAVSAAARSRAASRAAGATSPRSCRTCSSASPQALGAIPWRSWPRRRRRTPSDCSGWLR